MLARYIQCPVGEKLLEVVNDFYESFGFPQCASAIDGSHIPVLPPLLHHTDYCKSRNFRTHEILVIFHTDTWLY